MRGWPLTWWAAATGIAVARPGSASVASGRVGSRPNHMGASCRGTAGGRRARSTAADRLQPTERRAPSVGRSRTGRERNPPWQWARTGRTVQAGSTRRSAGAGLVGEEACMRRYLIVAHRTLGGADLLDRLRGHVEAGPCRFHLLVPVTHPADHVWTEGEVRSAAQRRLDVGLDALRKLGLEATGEIGDVEPRLCRRRPAPARRALRRPHRVDAAAGHVALGSSSTSPPASPARPTSRSRSWSAGCSPPSSPDPPATTTSGDG